MAKTEKGHGNGILVSTNRNYDNI